MGDGLGGRGGCVELGGSGAAHTPSGKSGLVNCERAVSATEPQFVMFAAPPSRTLQTPEQQAQSSRHRSPAGLQDTQVPTMAWPYCGTRAENPGRSQYIKRRELCH